MILRSGAMLTRVLLTDFFVDVCWCLKVNVNLSVRLQWENKTPAVIVLSALLTIRRRVSVQARTFLPSLLLFFLLWNILLLSQEKCESPRVIQRSLDKRVCGKSKMSKNIAVPFSFSDLPLTSRSLLRIADTVPNSSQRRKEIRINCFLQVQRALSAASLFWAPVSSHMLVEICSVSPAVLALAY